MHVAVAHEPRLVVPDNVVNVVFVLQIHRQALKPVGDLAAYELARDAAYLLKICKLRHLHAVQPNLPAKPPGP